MDRRIAASLERKAADAKDRTAMLAGTNILLACGISIAGDTAEDKEECMELMGMYRKAKLGEMRVKLSHKADAGQGLDKSDGIDDNSDSEDGV